ncbi:MAG: LysE family transporter, partial [Pseudomonadales bacterium]|nr:LysE family transporter [Pseudomonadales bacterium]
HVGGYVHVIAAALGLAILFQAVPSIYLALKLVGAAYLIWLGVAAFRTQQQNTPTKTGQQSSDARTSSGWAFRNGFVCNALNPKTALFFIALFTQVVDPATPAVVQIGLGIFIAAVHLLWFAIVAVLLTHPRFKAKFDRSKSWIERVVGICLIGLGAKLALSS